jgi:RNA polymerase sigma-70 factor (ECF subfamily)
MLGSVHDADDALQDTLVRAWRGAAGLRDASSARPWLFSIATNVCLTELERRNKRVLPHDFGQASAGHMPPGAPQIESTWIEPYPTEGMGIVPSQLNPMVWLATSRHLLCARSTHRNPKRTNASQSNQWMRGR